MANVTRESKTVLTAEDRTGSAFASMQKSVASAQASIMSMHSALTGLVAGGVIGAFGAMVKHSIDYADSLNKMAQKTGIATEELSKLSYAAKLSDVSNESLTKGIKGLAQEMTKATDATSLQAAASAFDEHLGRLAKTMNTRRAFASETEAAATVSALTDAGHAATLRAPETGHAPTAAGMRIDEAVWQAARARLEALAEPTAVTVTLAPGTSRNAAVSAFLRALVDGATQVSAEGSK